MVSLSAQYLANCIQTIVKYSSQPG